MTKNIVSIRKRCAEAKDLKLKGKRRKETGDRK
jgi:hypothetical protein